MSKMCLPESILDPVMLAAAGTKDFENLTDAFESIKNVVIKEKTFIERFHSPVLRGHYYAQIAHESIGFDVTEENLNYSPRRAFKIWPHRFESLEHARQLCKSKRKLFDHLYGGRMGNEPDEGYLYIGRGFIQLTGKDNARRVSKITGIDYVNDPYSMADDPGAWIVTYAYLLSKGKRLAAPLRNGNVNRATRIINGGRNGLYDREERFENVQAIIDGIEPGQLSRRGGILEIFVQFYLAATVDSRLVIDGMFGPASIRTLQKATDGKYSKSVDKEFIEGAFKLLEEIYSE